MCVRVVFLKNNFFVLQTQISGVLPQLKTESVSPL